ncbi:MAG: ABC transporter substrate-binding protein [Elusimicrobia bacterium]|nr:ABC transporter substrate-binding protein [Elusimicrobiota bacterium]
MKKIIRIGHSPDPDDAFMFYGLAKKRVSINGYEIEHVILDIQTLNESALKSELDITAISAAVYPFVAEDYWILSCGASVGRNYGPILVAKKNFNHSDLKGKKIAVPGLQTTAYLLLKIFLKDFKPVPMDFKEIIPAVLKDEVDLGLVIHEGQLNFSSYGLEKCLDLGNCWFEKFNLPIPLGLDVVKKDLGLAMAKKIKEALVQSIQYAMENESQALEYALEFGRGISKESAKKFVGMYVNEDTLDLGNDGSLALEKLFGLGYEFGFFKEMILPEII